MKRLAAIIHAGAFAGTIASCVLALFTWGTTDRVCIGVFTVYMILATVNLSIYAIMTFLRMKSEKGT